MAKVDHEKAQQMSQAVDKILTRGAPTIVGQEGESAHRSKADVLLPSRPIQWV